MGRGASASAAPAIGEEIRAVAMRGEPDRFLAAVLAPTAARAGLAAIAAFAAELARIPASVREPMLGEIRLQWWRDALAAGRGGERTGHPVADALCDAERRHGLAPELLEAMIEARGLDLAGGMPHDDAGLVAYLQATEGNAFLLALMALGVPADEGRPVARAAGEAYGIARALSRLPMLFHNGGFPLPAERLRSAGLNPERLAERPPGPDVLAAVGKVMVQMRDIARAARVDAIAARACLGKRARAALLPLAMVEPYFRAQSGRSLLVEFADLSPLSRVIRIGLAHVTGRL